MFALSTTAAAAQTTPVTEVAGWPNVLSSLLAQYGSYDVLALGEAHGREVDAELRLRLVRHPNLSRAMRLIVLEFPDDQLSSAVADMNGRRSQDEQIQIVVDRALSSKLIAERVRRGEKAVVVYGAGHVWKGEGPLTKDLLTHGLRVLVVQTLAPPTPAAALQKINGGLRQRERPLLVALPDSAAGQTRAADVFPNEPIPPTLVLADLADLAVVFDAGGPTTVKAADGKDPSAATGFSIRLTGRLVGLYPKGRKVYFLLAAESGAIGTERWAVQGGSLMELAELGWNADLTSDVRLGDSLVVEGRIAGNLEEAADRGTLPQQVATALRNGRLVVGATIRLPDGRTLGLGPKP